MFSGRIPGGSRLFGPCGILEIDEGHRPKWVRDYFDSGEIDAEDPNDDKVEELVALMRGGHARVLAKVGYMHVPTKVTYRLFGSEEGEEGEGEDGGTESAKKKPKTN